MDKIEDPSAYHRKIKDWPKSERPRERLLDHGPARLSDAELLALLIGSGAGGATAVDIAKTLLSEHGSLWGLASKNIQEYSRMKGIGPARASKIAAAFEIGRRAAAAGEPQGAKIRGPEDIARLFSSRYRDLKREVFTVVLLDGANRIIRDESVSQGVLNASVVAPREVFKPAVDHGAAGVILVHNHPSRETAPSGEDRGVTGQLVRAGEIMGIPVLDHVILAGGGYFSFAKEGLLKP